MNFLMGHDYPDWHDDARCKGLPQEWFFGEDNDVTTSKRHRPTLTMSEVRRAQAVCHRCPVRMQCLEYALVNHEEFGIWGGTTGRDRSIWLRQNEAQRTALTG